MDKLQSDREKEQVDARNSLIISSLWLLFMFFVAFFIKFDARPDQLIDTPPLRSDEVIEEFQIDNVSLADVSGGSRGGGAPGSGRIGSAADQSERVATTNRSDFNHNSGQSNNNNSPNGQNPSTSPQPTNFFSGGGSGNVNGSGNGQFGGPGRENGDPNDGRGNGRGSGQGRVLENNVSLPLYRSDFDCRIGFKLQVNAEGKVIGVITVRATTTCVDDRTINDIKERIKREVKYNKDPGAGIVEKDYTINLKARS